MDINLTLPNDIGARLISEAQKRGSSPHDVVAELITKHLPNGMTTDKNLKAIKMLERWAKEDEEMTEEQSEKNRAVLKAIDEDRLRCTAFVGQADLLF